MALSPWPGRFDAAARLYSYLESGESEYALDIVRYGSDLRPEATLRPPSPPEPESFFGGRTVRGSDLRARIPFTPRLVWRLDSTGGFVWVWTADPRILRSDARGAASEIAPVPARAAPVSADEREAALESLRRFREMGGRIEPDRIPDRKPPIRTFVLDERDRAWVMATASPSIGGSRWWVVEPGGGVAGPLDLPVRLEAFPTPVVRSSTVVGVERDGFGVEWVVLLRVDG